MKQLELFEIELLPAQHPKDRQGHKWNEVEEKMLTLAVAGFQTPLEIARGRSEGGVEARMKLLQLETQDEPIFEEV